MCCAPTKTSGKRTASFRNSGQAEGRLYGCAPWARDVAGLSLTCSGPVANRGALRQGEGVEIVLNRNEEVLAAVEFVGHGRGHEFSADVEMPEGFARGGIHGEQIAGIVGGKEQMTGSGQN